MPAYGFDSINYKIQYETIMEENIYLQKQLVSLIIEILERIKWKFWIAIDYDKRNGRRYLCDDWRSKKRKYNKQL